MSLPRSRRARRQDSLYNKYLPPQSRRRKFVNYIVIPLVALLVFIWLFDNVIMLLITRHGTEFKLADITGYKFDDAEALLKSADLEIEVISEEYHADKDEGTVLSQYPPAGTKVKAGRIIKVVTSIGQKNVRVPPLAGFSVRQARLNIEGAGLVLGDIAWTFSDSLPEKVVVFSYPASGTEIPMGSPVNLMVNRGSLSGIVFMPKLVGRPLEEARAILDELDLRIGLVTHVRDENYLPETVLEQSVEEATELEVGEEIDLVVTTTE